jgi:hypothetical protein
MKACFTFCLLLGTLAIATAQTPATAPQTAATATSSTPHIASGSHLFIEPMDGFETYLSAAILKKKVPVFIVDDKAKADYIVNGTSHVQKAGWAKTIFVSPASSAGASITIKDAKTGDLAFAYSVDKINAARAAQSTAEACAKHLKQAIEKK